MADFTPLNREMKERAKAQRKTMTGRHSDLGLSYEKWNQRKSELQSNGVLRYSEADIFFNFNGVCKHIESITSERLKELGHEDLISESQKQIPE